MAVAGRGSRFTRPFPGAQFSRSKGTVVGRLYGNLDTGEGDVTLILEYDNLTLEMRRDLLQDWISLLTAELDNLVTDAYEHYTRIAEEARV